MACKIVKKKRAYQDFCRKQVKEHGLVNAADGTWKRADPGKSMDAHQLAGYQAR